MVAPLQDKYISLLTDFGFKRVFGTEPNKRLLINFLNTLPPSDRQIEDVTFKNSENVDNTSAGRKAIYNKQVEVAEIAKIANFSPAEQESYQNSLKYYRDLNNVVNTSRQEGSLEGRRSLLLRMLSRKIGEMPESIRDQVNTLPDHRIDELGDALLDFSVLEGLLQWLQQ